MEEKGCTVQIVAGEDRGRGLVCGKCGLHGDSCWAQAWRTGTVHGRRREVQRVTFC